MWSCKKKTLSHRHRRRQNKVAMGTLALNGLAFVGLKSQTLCCINYVLVELLCTEYEICFACCFSLTCTYATFLKSELQVLANT